MPHWQEPRRSIRETSSVQAQPSHAHRPFGWMVPARSAPDGPGHRFSGSCPARSGDIPPPGLRSPPADHLHGHGAGRSSLNRSVRNQSPHGALVLPRLLLRELGERAPAASRSWRAPPHGGIPADGLDDRIPTRGFQAPSRRLASGAPSPSGLTRPRRRLQEAPRSAHSVFVSASPSQTLAEAFVWVDAFASGNPLRLSPWSVRPIPNMVDTGANHAASKSERWMGIPSRMP